MQPAAAIALCITRCRTAQDGRGPWQAQKALRDTLSKDGDPAIAANCAAAARRIGEWLRTFYPNVIGNAAPVAVCSAPHAVEAGN